MHIVRESRLADLEQVLEIAKHLNSCNLPYDRGAVTEILEASCAGFAGDEPPEKRVFTFVAENLDTGEIVGTSMLYGQHGTPQSPHVYFDVSEVEFSSETLQTNITHQALQIGYDYDGPSEIGGLILLPQFRRHKESLGKLLSFARFLFIAMNRDGFRDRVLSELLPRLNDDGSSDLWEHCGSRFTGLGYRVADRLSKDNKEFIKSLFPRDMIYTSLFPEDVRNEIGVVGPNTKGVEKMLTRIGFQYEKRVDPFDGGPHYIADTDSISLVADARPYALASHSENSAGEANKYIVARPRTDKHPFHCTWAQAKRSENRLWLAPETRRALDVQTNEPLWAATL